MAMDDHRHVKIQDGDTVVISATPIPGNEDTVFRVINNLLRQGANVIHPQEMDVHVSGHGDQEELTLMLNLIRPLYVVPVHDEYRHLELWRRMASPVDCAAVRTDLRRTLNKFLQQKTGRRPMILPIIMEV